MSVRAALGALLAVLAVIVVAQLAVTAPFCEAASGGASVAAGPAQADAAEPAAEDDSRCLGHPNMRRGLLAITARNRWGLTERLLDQLDVVAESLPVDVVLLDDASEDGTQALAAARGVRVISNMHAEGVTYTWNQAYRLFKHECFGYLFNSINDVDIPRGALTALAEAIDANPAAGLVGPMAARSEVGQASGEAALEEQFPDLAAPLPASAQAVQDAVAAAHELAVQTREPLDFFVCVGRGVIAREPVPDHLFEPGAKGARLQPTLVSRRAFVRRHKDGEDGAATRAMAACSLGPESATGALIAYLRSLTAEAARGCDTVTYTTLFYGAGTTPADPGRKLPAGVDKACALLIASAESASELAAAWPEQSKWTVVVADFAARGDDVRGVDNRKLSRLAKLAPHLFFPEARFTLFVDFKLELRVLPRQLVRTELQGRQVGMAMVQHPCTMPDAMEVHNVCKSMAGKSIMLSEIAVVLAKGKTASPERLQEQRDRYAALAADGVAFDRLVDGGLILRDSTSVTAREVSCRWLTEYMREDSADRDQPALAYVLATAGEGMWMGPGRFDFTVTPHWWRSAKSMARLGDKFVKKPLNTASIDSKK